MEQQTVTMRFYRFVTEDYELEDLENTAKKYNGDLSILFNGHQLIDAVDGWEYNTLKLEIDEINRALAEKYQYASRGLMSKLITDVPFYYHCFKKNPDKGVIFYDIDVKDSYQIQVEEEMECLGYRLFDPGFPESQLQ